MRRHLTLTQQIFIGLALGIVLGWIISVTNPAWADVVRPFGQIFIRMIKMIIAPLIFATLVAGIAGAGHAKAVGRIGLRSIIYFEVVTTVALVVGLVAVNWFKPGAGLTLPAAAGAAAPVAARPQTWQEILLHTVPESVLASEAGRSSPSARRSPR
jgi:proton glutamate symport protein